MFNSNKILKITQMFFNFDIFQTSILFCLLLFCILTQTEPTDKKPRKNSCIYGFPETSSNKCDSNKLIKCEDRCDFSNECEDKSDEKNCGQCDFNEDMCGWKNMDKGLLSWARVDDDSGTECSANQNQTCVLSLLKVRSNKNVTKTYKTTRIRSPKFQSTPLLCDFGFEYKHNEHDCLLSVNLVSGNEFIDRLQLINEDDNNWRRQTVDVANLKPSAYQIEFSVDCNKKLTNRKPNQSLLKISIKNTFWINCHTNASISSNGFECDFQTSLCDKWTDIELTNDKYLHWKRSNNYPIFGNHFDDKSDEYFVYTEKYDNKKTSLVARLSSFKQQSTDTPVSLSFQYLVTNMTNSGLYLLIKQVDFNGIVDKTEIWKSKPSKSLKWQNACVNITTNFTVYQLIFEARFEGTSSQTIIAIKNITELTDDNCIDDMLEMETTLMTTTFEYATLIRSNKKIPNFDLADSNLEFADPNASYIDIDKPPNRDKPIQYSSNTADSNNLDNYYIKVEFYGWILKGIALLIIALIFVTIRFWRKRTKKIEELVPLTDSSDFNL